MRKGAPVHTTPLADELAKVLTLVGQVADIGAPCPSYRDMRKLAGVQRDPQHLVRMLRDRGILVRQSHPTDVRTRRLQVISTGRWTDWTSVEADSSSPRIERVRDADAYLADKMQQLGARYEDVKGVSAATGRRLSGSSAVMVPTWSSANL